MTVLLPAHGFLPNSLGDVINKKLGPEGPSYSSYPYKANNPAKRGAEKRRRARQLRAGRRTPKWVAGLHVQLAAKTCRYASWSNCAHEIPSKIQISQCAWRSNVTVLSSEQQFHPTTWTPEA